MWLRGFVASALLGWLLMPPGAHGQTVEEADAEKVEAAAKAAAQGRGVDLSRVAKVIISRTNEFRREQGREPVKPDPKLTKAARYFADYMARTGEYGHTADGNRPAGRASKFGYDYCIVLENIAYQYSSAGFQTEELGEKFFEGWKHSPGHRKNMLDPDVTETGVAVAQSEDTGYYYAVQMFGRPKSAAIEFQVANHLGDTARYRIGERTFPLPPRYTRTHTRCRPADLTFLLPDDKQGGKGGTETVRPRDGDRFLIVRDQGRVRVKRE